MPAAALVREMEAIGCAVTITGGVASVSTPQDPRHRQRFNTLLVGLRQHREAVLAYLGNPRQSLCPLCKRDVSCPENKERLRGVNPWCGQGFLRAEWRNGKMIRQKQDGCPYREGV